MAVTIEAAGAARPRLLGADDDLTAGGEGPPFPASVVALGRGGAGDAGALLLPDGTLAGLLCLDAGSRHEGQADGEGGVAALAAALPAGTCQLVTVRRPVDLERQVVGWQGVVAGRPEQAALVTSLVDELLPWLAAAGWSETQTLLALFGD